MRWLSILYAMGCNAAPHVAGQVCLGSSTTDLAEASDTWWSFEGIVESHEQGPFNTAQCEWSVEHMTLRTADDQQIFVGWSMELDDVDLAPPAPEVGMPVSVTVHTSEFYGAEVGLVVRSEGVLQLAMHDGLFADFLEDTSTMAPLLVQRGQATGPPRRSIGGCGPVRDVVLDVSSGADSAQVLPGEFATLDVQGSELTAVNVRSNTFTTEACSSSPGNTNWVAWRRGQEGS